MYILIFLLGYRIHVAAHQYAACAGFRWNDICSMETDSALSLLLREATTDVFELKSVIGRRDKSRD